MKTILACLFLVLAASSSHADSDSPILDYGFGNQIYGSYLQVFASGKVVHQERSCCPPHTDDVKAKRLGKNEMNALRDLIAKAALESVTTGPCPGDLGEIYGSLAITTDSDEKIVLRAASVESSGKCRNTIATGPATEALLDFVNKYVETKIP